MIKATQLLRKHGNIFFNLHSCSGSGKISCNKCEYKSLKSVGDLSVCL